MIELTIENWEWNYLIYLKNHCDYDSYKFKLIHVCFICVAICDKVFQNGEQLLIKFSTKILWSSSDLHGRYVPEKKNQHMLKPCKNYFTFICF